MGAGSKNSISHLFELINSVHPDILILMETRVHSSFVLSFISSSVFTHFAATETIGFSGGIWLLWNSSVGDLEVLAVDDQIVSALVLHG